MLYLFETELPKNKATFISFTRIFGIGKFHSILICKQIGFSENFKTNFLSNEQTNIIIKIFEYLNLKITSDLKKLNNLVWKKQISIKCYKGLRKFRGLPVRGQRTHTNCRTSRKFSIKNIIYGFCKK